MTKQKLIDEINYSMQNTLKIREKIKPDSRMSGFWEGYFAALEHILNVIDVVDED